MDSLQFQKLELADSRPKCISCKSPIENLYYHFGGQTICPTCANIARASQERPGNAAIMRGFLYGLGAAAACSVGYAAITVATNMQFALIAILAGYLVGRAIRIGSRGLGGRRCQILAVLLTYLAITISYVPLVIKELKEQQTRTDAPQSYTSPQPPAPKVTVASFAVALAVVSAISIASPFFGLANGVSGIIGIFILFVGLAQAWKQTKRDERLLLGPYEMTEGQAVG